jgi:hypothetical protein
MNESEARKRSVPGNYVTVVTNEPEGFGTAAQEALNTTELKSKLSKGIVEGGNFITGTHWRAFGPYGYRFVATAISDKLLARGTWKNSRVVPVTSETADLLLDGGPVLTFRKAVEAIDREFPVPRFNKYVTF